MIVIPEDGFDNSPVDGLSANANASSGEGEDAPASSETTPGSPLNTKSDPATPPPEIGDSWSFDRRRPGLLPVSASAPTAADTPTPGDGQVAGAAAWQRLQTAQQGVDDSPYAGASSGSPAQTVGDSWQFPGWANNQRFGIRETQPAGRQDDDLNGLRFDPTQSDGREDYAGMDELSRDILQGFPRRPRTYGDDRRPWADDFMANYVKERVDKSNPTGAVDGWGMYNIVGGQFAKEANRSKLEPNSCALRVSRALDLAGGVNGPYAIPLAPDDHFYVNDAKLLSYDIVPDSNLPNGKTGPLAYISGAAEMNTYLQHVWGPPDMSITMNKDDNGTAKANEVYALQARLKPGEALVFARGDHTGVITSDYIDQYGAAMDVGKMNFWLLQPKPR